MSLFSGVVLFSGVILEVCLVGCLLWKGRWRRYPYFSFCVICFVARTFLFFLVPPSQYANVYWATDTIDVLLRFLVVWELFRHVFSEGSALTVLFSRGFAVVVAAALMLALGTFWSYQTYANSHSFRAALERSASFTQAIMTLGLLLAARYYGIPLGRPIRAMAIAFGAWTSIATANNAMIDLERSFLPYWQIVRPLSFVALIGAWTWALWKEVPDPHVAPYPDQVSELSVWTENWNRTQASLRKVKPS